MIRKKSISIVFIVFALTLVGCFGDLFEFENYKDLKIQPKVAVPLGFASFSIQDLITAADAEANFTEDENGTLIILFEDSIRTSDFISELAIGEFSISDSIGFDVSQSMYLPPDTSLILDTVEFHIPYLSDNEQRIDSMVIKSGFIKFLTRSNLIGDLKFSLIFPGISDPDNFNRVEEIIVEGSSEGIDDLHLIDLTDSHIEFTQEGEKNGITFKILTEFISKGGYLSSHDGIVFFMEISLISLERIHGYLGNQVFSFPDKTIYLDFFKTFEEGSINFRFPYLLIEMLSTIDIPLSLEIGTFYTEIANDEILPLTGSVLDSQVYLLPDPLVNQTGFPSGEIIVNPENSSFRDIFPRLPKQIIFDLQSEINPDSFSGYYNNLYDTSDVYANVSLGIPLSLTAKQLEGTDTTSLDWGDIDLDYVKQLAVKVRSENGLPFGGDIRLLFLDENDEVVLDLFNGYENLIVPAKTDDLGIPVESSVDSLNIELTENQIENLFESNRLVYYVIADTDQSDEDRLVSLTRDSFLNIFVGVSGDLELVVDFN